VFFDVVSKWLAAHSAKPRKEGYQPPSWTYGVDAAELASLPLADVEPVRLPHGRGVLAGFAIPLLSRLVKAISVYRARTIAASSSITTTPATTSSAASSAKAATAARATVRATRRDA
jgi:hypothetical protein